MYEKIEASIHTLQGQKHAYKWTNHKHTYFPALFYMLPCCWVSQDIPAWFNNKHDGHQMPLPTVISIAYSTQA
jgi:hypothetical protein